MPQRQTALVAKQAAEVDVLTGGRLRLGVALGWAPPEFQALGAEFSSRDRRVEELRGGYGTVQHHVRPWRTGQPPTAPPTRPLTAREISGLLLRDPDSLDAEDQTRRTAVRDACPQLNRLADHVSRFAVMVTGLRGDRLDRWLTAVEDDDQPELHSFAAGIRPDYEAVRNGLTLRHASGPVEGHVNRIKMIKRQMYGRANLDLLRKRVLLA